MFIRWKRSKLRLSRHDFKRNEQGKIEPVRCYSLRCELVESYRNEEGKPRQRTKKYLASIHENHLGNAIKRNTFWYAVDLRLGRLELAPDEEAKLRGMLERRVPRPPAETMKAVQESLLRGLLP